MYKILNPGSELLPETYCCFHAPVSSGMLECCKQKLCMSLAAFQNIDN